MKRCLFLLCMAALLSLAYAGPDNNLYDRNKREANCDTTGCYPRRPPYTMPKGYVAADDEEEEEEEVADSVDYETETGSSQRLIF